MAKREKLQYRLIWTPGPPSAETILLNLVEVTSHGDYEYVDIVDPATNTTQRFTREDVKRRFAT